MELGTVLKVAHVGTMFLAVGVAVGTEIMAHRIADSRDVRSIRTFFGQAGAVMKVVPILYVAGALFGLLAAFARAFDPFARWLLLAYGLFFLTFLLHRAIGAPWFERMTRLAAAAPDGVAGGELRLAIEDPRARALFWYTLAMIVGFVFLMVVKPFA